MSQTEQSSKILMGCGEMLPVEAKPANEEALPILKAEKVKKVASHAVGS